LNDDLIVARTGSGSQNETASPRCFVSTDKSPQIVIETIKRSEYGKSVVIRFYECCRTRGTTRLTFGMPLKEARLCNLLEEPIKELELNGNSIEVPYKPYEIISILVEFDKGEAK
jgi:alpha-mannosidase